MRNILVTLFIIQLLFLASCNDKKNTTVKEKTKAEKLFTQVPSTTSNVTFQNNVTETLEFNFLNYPYIYIGGGVATGDFNNDGLTDIYFTANQKQNKLYLNKGNLSFEDVTDKAKVSDNNGWSTGVSLVDINNDGWLDIYVCKSASVTNNDLRRNKLFINNQDGTFKEQAKQYGIDDPGFSTQAYFFDYDKDGDLDIYVVNHRPDFSNNGKISSEIQRDKSPLTSDQLYQNNGDNTFTNTSLLAGISNKAWGLSAAVGDFNNDGWYDIYVCNDYLEPDILYVNNKNGTFSDQVLNRMNHISFNSMGSDLADIDNDGFQDLIVLDMLADDHERGKENMATMSTSNFWAMVNVGYHHQYMSNMLQKNDGNGYFSEIGQLAGINKTDWSWAPLFADFDNDGYKDLFVTNGIYKDLGNQDFRRSLNAKNAQGEAMTLQGVLDMAPSSKLSNKAFQNKNGLEFVDTTKNWGLDLPTFSNGVAYADLDNDGDLDLVINNFNSEALIYENQAHLNTVQVKLTGFPKNNLAIGSRLTLVANNQEQHHELFLARGFESSVDNVVSFGIGTAKKIEQLSIEWPNGMVTEISDLPINSTQVINYNEVEKQPKSQQNNSNAHFTKLNPNQLGIDFNHVENDFNDFSLQVLLPQKKSTVGGAVAVGDVNGDGLEDFFVGNALNATAELYLQNNEGKFQLDTSNLTLWKNESKYEDINAHFFDADNDNDLDLYVVSGGYELKENDHLLQDRLYLNNGNGTFKKSSKLPKMLTSGKSIATADIDNDGDLDIFVGGNVVPGKYPETPFSYLLENDKGTFKDITSTAGKELKQYGIINDAIFTDIDNDKDPDLVIAGEWIPITVFKNNNGVFTKSPNETIETKTGWWNSLLAHDFDNDGDLDLIAGNFGTNNKFHPSEKKPLHVYGKDFDKNGSYDMVLSKIYKGKLVPVRGKECSTEQNPFVSEKIKTYKEFAQSELTDIYGKEDIENAYHLKATYFKTAYLENDGSGRFTIKELDIKTQLGPTFAMIAKDINNDGHMDIIGTGNEFNAEVETIRYDASKGFVLLGDSKGNFTPLNDNSFYNNNNSKDLKIIKIKNKEVILVANNNGPLELFRIN